MLGEEPLDDDGVIDAHSAATERDPTERALALAYRFIGRRERTVTELLGHLTAKGVGEPLAQDVVAELTEQGYVDDRRFAALFAEDKRALEGWGSERIRRALRERGVARELVEAAVSADGGAGEPGEMQRALALLARRYPEPPRDHREHERALGFLLRKGYDSELALDALRAHERIAPGSSIR